MSLTVCSPQLGLAPNSILGGEVFDREILMGLAKKGVKIEIILPKNKPHDKNIKNWTISYLPIAHFPAILANLLYIPAIFSIYRKSKFQILRVHQPQFFSTTAIIFKLFYPNVKIVATYHQFKETKFWLFSLKKWAGMVIRTDFLFMQNMPMKRGVCSAVCMTVTSGIKSLR